MLHRTRVDASAVDIRPAQDTDVRGIELLFREEARVARSRKQAPALGDFYPQAMREYVRRQESGCLRHQLLVAEDEGQVVGFIQALHRLPARGDFTALHRWGVHSDYQGKGIGSALFEAVGARAHMLGKAYIEVELPRGNPIEIYERLGFKKVAEHAPHQEGRRPKSVLQRPCRELLREGTDGNETHYDIRHDPARWRAIARHEHDARGKTSGR